MAIEVERVIHVNLNVTAVDEAARFFTDLVGLSAISHMHADPQDGAGMGIAGPAQWNGYSIHGADLWDDAMIDLLEWLEPPTVGSPYAEPNHVGFSRLGIGVENPGALHRRLDEAGVRCLSVPVEIDGRWFFCAPNADGTVLEFAGGAREPALQFVNINCSDLHRSADWYRRHLGFTDIGPVRDYRGDGAPWGSDGNVRWRALHLALPGREDRFGVQLTEWLDPVPCGEPYRAPNHAGLYRLALAVADARDSYRRLLTEGVDCPYEPVWLDMGPEIPIEGLWALFFRDPDGICVELIQNPQL